MAYPNRFDQGYRYKMNTDGLKGFSYTLGPIRPPSEGRDSSLLVRAVINCPWNRCAFCKAYGDEKFIYRKTADIKADIDIIKGLHDELKAASLNGGYGGEINNDVVKALIRGTPEVYDVDQNDPKAVNERVHGLINVAGWAASGGKTVFLQDADALIMRTDELADILTYLKTLFPGIERITSYGRSKTAAKKSDAELKALYQAGLTRLHVGLESGSDQVLELMKKGVTAAGHIKGGRKIVKSGISLSEYVMPGLGGRTYSREHAVETARVLNEINPDFIRLRSLIARKGTALRDKIDRKEFEELNEEEVVDEIEQFIQHLDCRSYLVSDQMSNLLWEIEGSLPDDKERLLNMIRQYKERPRKDRLSFRLKRRLKSYLSVYGGMHKALERSVQDALDGLNRNDPDAEEKVEAALASLKSNFV